MQGKCFTLQEKLNLPRPENSSKALSWNGSTLGQLTVEEQLDDGEEEEASQQGGVLVGLPVDVGAQEQGGGDDGHECSLHTFLDQCKGPCEMGGGGDKRCWYFKLASLSSLGGRTSHLPSLGG